MALATSRSNLGRRVGFATIVALVGACGGGSKPAPKPAQPEILAEGRFDDSRLGTALVLVRSDEPTGVTLFASAVPLHMPFEPAELRPDLPQPAGADGYLLRFTGERFATVSELPEATLPENSNPGWSMVALGDLDGDGHPDLAVGVPRLCSSFSTEGTQESCRSFPDATERCCSSWLRHSEYGFGWSLAVERTDTKERLAVGAPSALGTCRVHVYDLRTRALELSIDSTVKGSDFGSALAFVGDWNGDGQGDLVIGDPYEEIDGLRDAGRVRVLDGATGAELASYRGTGTFSYYGRSVASVPDVDEDGRRELLLGNAAPDLPQSHCGRVEMIGSREGAVLWSVTGQESEELGSSVSCVVDFDDDGVDDFAICSNRDKVRGVNTGSCWIYSTRTGSLLDKVPGETCTAMRLDDGTIVLVTGASRESPEPPEAHGRVRAFTYPPATPGSRRTRAK
jgi:hypothetical protein